MVTVQELREIPILKSLADLELENLGQVLLRRRAPKGTFILCAEDPGPSLMFLAAGEVKITLHSSDGKEVVLANLDKGDFFGEIAILTGEDRSANVVAVTECELYVLSAEDFHRHLLGNSGLVLAMARELAVRLRQASAKIADLALYDVYRRIARTLKSLGKAIEREGEKLLIIAERPTHQELASMTGTSREMVTRALKGLEEDGYIRMDGKEIVILKTPG